ncbi:hypothetical protein [Ferviditalea candida]|uniref:Uncharacterized protein n=1 Tax=Ferviditalea candida TaxID=3108399 RepID=A0ABU5ZP54_9BACL|nr:hypothetical protein [Paenibacillaceae bacterium T2]
MKKTQYIWACLCLTFTMFSIPYQSLAQPVTSAYGGVFDDDEEECTKNVQFTEDDKKKLNQLMDEMYTLNKEIIETYTRAGAFKESRKKQKLENLQKFIETVKEKNFKVCSEFKKDEIEYDVNPLR